MKNRTILAVLLLFYPITALSQNVYPRKDMAFTPIAVGTIQGLEYETVLNVTNRGTTTYNGTLKLFSAGQPWSPMVNGAAITAGEMAIMLAPGASATYRITSSGTIEVGFGIIKSSSWELTNFVDGTITYYVSSGGMLIDSIGVPPSSETYLATIPFDDFNAIALALSNAGSDSADVELKLFSADNQLMETVQIPTLLPNEHYQAYLDEIASVTMTNGRFEIQSDIPILAMVLTDVNNQFSSLPLLPGVRAYTIQGIMGGTTTITGEFCMWINGIAVEGYMRVLTMDGQPLPPELTGPAFMFGQLVDGVLEVYFSEGSYNDDGIAVPSGSAGYAGMISSFSLSMDTAEGSFMYYMNDLLMAIPGTATLTAIN